MLPRHRGQHLAAHLLQQHGVAPGRVGHDVVQRLMHLPHLARRQTRRHRLDALALEGQEKALGVILHGDDAIGVSGDLRQMIQIGGQTLRRAGGVFQTGSHRPQLTTSHPRLLLKSQREHHLYNTVTLATVDSACQTTSSIWPGQIVLGYIEQCLDPMEKGGDRDHTEYSRWSATGWLTALLEWGLNNRADRRPNHRRKPPGRTLRCEPSLCLVQKIGQITYREIGWGTLPQTRISIDRTSRNRHRRSRIGVESGDRHFGLCRAASSSESRRSPATCFMST